MKCTKVLPKGEGCEFIATFGYRGSPHARKYRIEDGVFLVENPKLDKFVKAKWFPWKELKECRFIVV